MPRTNPARVQDLNDAQRRDWLQAEYVVQLAAWSDIAEQMPLLYEAACSREAPLVAELGTRSGKSGIALLAGAAETGGHVWSVDSGPVTVPGWWQATGLWSFLAADDMSESAAAFIPAELDILFIDTSHLFEHTLAELRRYAPRVRSGGVVLCHDVELRRDDEIMRTQDPPWIAWLEAAADGPEYPVAAALEAYCAEAKLSWERQPAPEIIRKGEPFYGLGTILIP